MTVELDTDEGGESTSNGASRLTYDEQLARDRAAFLAGDEGDDQDGDEPKAPAKKPGKGKPVESDDEDDDSDLDDDDQDGDESEDEDDAEETSEDDETSDEEDEDDDSDLDDDEDEDSDSDEDDEDVDPETKKRLQQVRRTDQRLRDQREKQFKAREQEIDDKVKRAETNLEAAWKPRIEKVEKFEKLLGGRDIVELAKAANYTEEDFADLARTLFAFSPDGTKDPKNKDAVARLREQRAQMSRIDKLEKELEEQRASEKAAAERAEQQKHVDAFVGKVTALTKDKALAEKTPLARQYLAKNPERARVDIEVIAGRLGQQLGRLPEPRKVMIELEKERRQILRDHGIDPKALHKTGTLKADPKKAKTTEAKKKQAADDRERRKLTFDEQRRLDREAFINDKFD